ncbi:MAG TPA: spermidine synthase [Actinomycetota bacterium]|nr:spermidine synthase [Actinomycetota bacterium]
MESAAKGSPAPAVAAGRGEAARLLVLSFLMLFVELALIRWAGSNIVYLSYFSNFVLLGSFLGIGLGFLNARTDRDLLRWAPVALAGLATLVRFFPVEIDRSGSELIYFGEFEPSGLPPWVMLPVVFVVVALALMTIADGVGRSFARFEPLRAYRLDVLGSIAGIAAFSLLSFLHAPPFAWGVVAAVTLVWLLRPRDLDGVAYVVVPLLALAVLLGVESVAPLTEWSPYYKIEMEEQDFSGSPLIQIDVNGIPHQSIKSTELRRASEQIYFIPYERANLPLEPDVLVIGAGSGSDVAIALANGAGHIDAVEIDPGIQEIGAELHPERPYADPRVETHIDDGRAFLERTDETYDLILFALPDSLTLVSGQSSLRLESFLFTRQAIGEAKEHLRPGGTFAMYNFYRERWLIDRLGATLTEVFGRRPCLDTVGASGGLAVLTSGLEETSATCLAQWLPAAEPPEPVSDDYPFLYIKDRGMPALYALLIALVLVVSVGAVRAVAGPLTTMRAYADLFFMGAAFLLLETKSVVQFALLFGTTWFVNALVFAGVLLAVLAAIEVARRVELRRPGPLYLALFAALLVAFLLPPSVFLRLSLVPRFVAAVAVAFAPIFLANLIFARRFRDVAASTIAFGANLLGAMVGGLIEYAAVVVGYRALLIVVALLYAAAFLTPRLREARPV